MKEMILYEEMGREQFLKKINIFKVFSFVSEAWGNVTPDIILNCFKESGIFVKHSAEDGSEWCDEMGEGSFVHDNFSICNEFGEEFEQKYAAKEEESSVPEIQNKNPRFLQIQKLWSLLTTWMCGCAKNFRIKEVCLTL